MDKETFCAQVIRHQEAMFRAAKAILKQDEDAEDAVQEAFLRLLTTQPVFRDAEHEKAWLIRVTINQCKDVLKSFFRRNAVSLDGLLPVAVKQEPQDTQTLEAVLSLPQKYRNVIYLHYYEGYAATEIADIMHKPVNTVYTMLSRARKLLKEKLGGDEVE